MDEERLNEFFGRVKATLESLNKNDDELLNRIQDLKNYTTKNFEYVYDRLNKLEIAHERISYQYKTFWWILTLIFAGLFSAIIIPNLI